jgi:hypothetical protein
MEGVAVQPAVKLDDMKVGKAQPGGFFHVDRDLGSYEVKCTTEWTHKITVVATEKAEKYVRLTMLPGILVGHVAPREVDPDTGKAEIANCNLIASEESPNAKPPAPLAAKPSGSGVPKSYSPEMW